MCKIALSKGKSLNANLSSASEENRIKLISDLFYYYENNLYWSSSISRHDERYARIYLKCKALMDRLYGIPSVIAKTVDN